MFVLKWPNLLRARSCHDAAPQTGCQEGGTEAKGKDTSRTLAGHSGAVYAVAFSPDSQWLATGSLDETIRFWEIRSGQVIRTLPGHSKWVNALAFSPDGSKIVSVGRDGTVRV